MACIKYKKIVWAKSICPRYGGKTTRDFTGFVGVSDPERSEIARKLGVKGRGWICHEG